VNTAIRVIKSGSEVGVCVTDRDDAKITITLPGPWFTVTYRKLLGHPDLDRLAAKRITG